MSDNTKLSKDGLNQVWLKAMTILKSLTGNVRTDKGTLQEQIDKLEENASSGVDLTQAEYDALPDSKETDGIDYYIIDEDFVATDAKAVGYDNTASRLAAKTVQVAIDEVCENAFGGINESKSEEALTRQTLGYSKKNLLPYPYTSKTRTENGITFTDNGDGSVAVKGTATSDVFFCFVHKTTKFMLDINNDYVISTNTKVTDGIKTVYAYAYDNDGTSLGVIGDAYVNDGKITWNENTAYIDVYMTVENGATVDITVYPMIRDAAIVDDTWEPYIPSVDERINALWAAINELNSQG